MILKVGNALNNMLKRGDAPDRKAVRTRIVILRIEIATIHVQVASISKAISTSERPPVPVRAVIPQLGVAGANYPIIVPRIHQ